MCLKYVHEDFYLILNCKFVNRYVYTYYGVYMGSGRGGGADQKKKKKKKRIEEEKKNQKKTTTTNQTTTTREKTTFMIDMHYS